MELLVSAKLALSKFHGIPWNCSSHRNWRTPSSMEFHGTALVIEIGALLVPWNSMELLVSAKLAHSKFHGIPWNCSSHRNWRTQSSMEFHGTALVIEIGALLFHGIPWNSLELLESSKLAHPKFHGIPWNSMELLLSSKLAHSWFHGIPLNSMEFHGTARISEIGAFLVPWNSMELLVSAKLAHSKFHGIPWNSMELLESSKLAHPKFHGIPWNCLCQRNWFTSGSMEFHGTVRVIEIGLFQVPWNSMELLLSAKLAHSKFYGIPWNSKELLVSWNLFLLFNGTIGIINALSFKMV